MTGIVASLFNGTRRRMKASLTTRLWGVALIAVLAVAACAPASLTTQPGGQGSAQAPAVKKRIVTAAVGNLYTLSGFISAGGGAATQPGLPETSQLFNV